MVVAVAARQPWRRFVERQLGEHGDAVEGFLSVDLDVVAQRLESFARECLVHALGFLETGDVGRALLEPRDGIFHPLLDRIHVPGSDAHGPQVLRVKDG